VQVVNKEMTAEDILEQIRGILDDDSITGIEQIDEIKDIIANEAVEIPFTTPRMDNSAGDSQYSVEFELLLDHIDGLQCKSE
jgi:hypothetical protein